MNYFFCGIGGIGMSAVALWLKAKGHNVSGSDRTFDNHIVNPVIDNLNQNEIRVFPQDGSGIDEQIACLVISSAIEDDNPDIIKAKSLNIPIKKRAEVLADIFHQYKGLSVSGTSGKTTITAMCGHILFKAGKNPTVLNGGILINDFGQKNQSNLIIGDSDVCVIESDESDGSIELYNPYVGIISNISLDHKPIEQLRPLFKNFASRCQAGCIFNKDCAETSALIPFAKNAKTFSLAAENNADYVATDITPTLDGISFKVNGIDSFLIVSGEHNIANALAAIAAVSYYGVDLATALEALKTFKGTKRRLEKIGTAKGVAIYDDYAHNPEKIKASIKTLSMPNTNNRLWIVFQPHGFAPTRLVKNDLIDVLSNEPAFQDIVIMPEIYYSGGTVEKNISSEDIINAVKGRGKQAFFFDNRVKIVPFIAEQVKSGDRILIMGARDASLTDFAKDILKQIEEPILS